MKDFRAFSNSIAFVIVLVIACTNAVYGQTYKPGDLYTFADGSKGIVFYVNPDDPSSGTVAALNDLEGSYPLWTGSKPSDFQYAFVPNGVSLYDITKWENHGKQCTQILAASGASPAASAVNVASGWYIPDLLQLQHLYGAAMTLQSSFELHGGDLLSIWSSMHWSVTQEQISSAKMYCIDGTMSNKRMAGTSAYLIRPVRDFPDSATVMAFWADCPPQSDTTVSPNNSTSYNALVIYRSDTLSLTSTVTVNQPVANILYDTTYVSTLPYTPALAPTFTNIDISSPGSYEYMDTLQTIHGCDSIVTLRLLVNNNTYYYETLCPLKGDYYYAPFDTVFQVGTVSGVYEHHGSKTTGGVTVDTTAFLNLTILPEYEVFDTVAWCLYESNETRVYDGNIHVTIAVNGESMTVTSNSGDVMVEDVIPGKDYMLKMLTATGCDSIIHMHVNVPHVVRDTVTVEMSITQLTGSQVTAACYTFTNVTGPGTYTLHDTLTSANGCDSIIVAILSVNPCASGFTITCPPDFYDTLAFGDCAMKVYPEYLGTATVQYDTGWHFLISNDFPADSLFAEGDNIVTWTATDTVCGNSVSCEQHVVIVFPQCPDAVDFEGNIYHGVRIGCECWTQRNLESTRYSDGSNIVNRYAYESLYHPDTATNISIFGRLYSYDAAVRDSSDNGHGHIQGICPEGWYLPTTEQYESLRAYGSYALRSPYYWVTNGGDNSTGFTALPAGFYNGTKDRYENLLTDTYFWSTQGVKQSTAISVCNIFYHCMDIYEPYSLSGLGYSVRCIKEK